MTTVDLAREALVGHRFAEARQRLQDIIDQDSTNADALCECLICDCYYGSEQASADRFEYLTELAATSQNKPQRLNDLELLLSRHFYCRSLLAERRGTTDLSANDWLSKHPYNPEKGVGISVSAILITKNEESCLASCLESLKGCVDEIVVVDTGSTDSTVRIAEKFGATIGTFEWVHDFSAARNAALELATGQWALWIDADEQLDETCKRRFEDAIIRPHIGGYSIQIVNYLDEGGTVVEFVHTPTRLFRNIEGVKFSEPIHEQITPSLRNLGLPWTLLENAKIHHDGYRVAQMDEKGKIERTMEMLLKVVENDPTNPFQLFNLANTFFVAKDYENAALYAKRAIDHLPPSGAEYGSACYQVWAVSLDVSGKHEEALAACRKCDSTPYASLVNDYLKATALMNLGRTEEAYIAIQDCLSKKWPSGLVGDKGIADFRRYGIHAQILGALGRYEESLAAFEDVLERLPDYPSSLLGRAMAHEKLGHYDEAVRDFREAMKEPTHVPSCLQGLAMIAERKEDWAEAMHCYREALMHSPERFDLWGGWFDAATKLEKSNTAFEFLSSIDYKELMDWGQLFADRPDLALRCYEAAIVKDPSESNTYFVCGDLLYKLGAFQEAIGVYESGLRLRMDYAEGWFVMGNSLAQINADEAAIQCYQMALKLDPNHFGAQQNWKSIAA